MRVRIQESRALLCISHFALRNVSFALLELCLSVKWENNIYLALLFWIKDKNIWCQTHKKHFIQKVCFFPSLLRGHPNSVGPKRCSSHLDSCRTLSLYSEGQAKAWMPPCCSVPLRWSGPGSMRKPVSSAKGRVQARLPPRKCYLKFHSYHIDPQIRVLASWEIVWSRETGL